MEAGIEFFRVLALNDHSAKGGLVCANATFLFNQTKNMRSALRTLVAASLVCIGVTAAPALAQSDVVLFGLTNSWRYNQITSYDGVNWTAPGFNDAGLPMGRSVLGREDANNSFVTAQTNTALTLGRNTYYFRKHFTFAHSPRGVALTFSNIVDDGAVFYLNGVEVARQFMVDATAPATYATLAANHEATGMDAFTISGPVVETNLVQGDNVLAVEVHQTTAGSSDIVFGSALSASFTLTPLPLNFPVTPPSFGYDMVNAFPGLNLASPFASPLRPAKPIVFLC